MASIAYSEQVGTKRQAGGRKGERQYLYRRMGVMANRRNSLIIPISSAHSSVLPCKRTEQRQKFLPGNGERKFQRMQRPLGNDNNVISLRQMRLIESEKLTHHTPDPVTHNRAPGFARHGKPQAPQAAVFAVTRKYHELLRVVTTPRIVAKQKIGPSAQPVSGLEGQTANFFRPLARLRRRMALPFGVLMRSRKPCVLLRLIRLG